MSTDQQDVVILGAGHAAGIAAQTLRMKKFDGPIHVVGEEAYVPYERPPLSKALLAGEMEIDGLYIKKPGWYADKNVTVHLNTRATAIDRQAQTVSLDRGDTLSYGHLLIATGGRVRKLTSPGADLPGIHYLRDIADVLGIQPGLKKGAKVAVVGGGYIGLEVAAVARKLGCEVIVLEALERVLNRVVDPVISDFYTKVHTDAGVDIRCGVGVAGFKGNGRVQQVELADGSLIDADVVIVGIGIIPNVELAQDAGLAVDNGIVVNDCARTEDPHIWAAGDVTQHPNALLGRSLRLESVQNAVSQAKAAVQDMLGDPKPYAEIPWFWSDQYDLKLQIAGLSELTDDVVVRGDPDSRSFSVIYLRDGQFVAVNAINAMKDYMAGRKLIAEGAKPDPARLADVNIPLKDVMS